MTKKKTVGVGVESKNATPKSEKRRKMEKKTPNRNGNKKSSGKNIVVFKDGGVDEKSLDKAEIEAAVEAVKKLNKDKTDGNDSLFNADEAKINLQITAIKLPKDERQQLVRIPLKHNPFPDPHEVCLVVKDLEKGTRPDHEPSKRHFQDLLKTKGVEGVSEVIPLRELKVEYKQYEAKTALCHRFDKFVVDDRIMRLVPKFLGKPMFKRKRFPVPVKLGAGDLKEEIARAIRTAVLPLNHHGTCSMINIGNASMKSAHVADNVLGVAGALARRYPGGWKNIRSIVVKCENTTAVPIHINTNSSNEVGFVDADIPKRITREALEDDLSTQPGMTVKVTPFGHVKVTRRKDECWDDEKDEPFVEGSEEEDEEDGVDVKEQNKKVSKKGKKRRSDKGEEDKQAKKKKKLAAETKEESDQDEKLEEAELRYMQKVADEEEEMEKKEGEENNAEEGSGESGGEEEEEEDEDDDDDEGLDEEDVVRDDEDDEDDQDSSEADDDELCMKNRSEGSDEDDESE